MLGKIRKEAYVEHDWELEILAMGRQCGELASFEPLCEVSRVGSETVTREVF